MGLMLDEAHQNVTKASFQNPPSDAGCGREAIR